MHVPKFENLATRIITALIAIPLIIWLTMLGGYLFFSLITVISSLALYEFYKLAEAKGVKPLKVLGLIFGILINSVFIYERFQVEIYRFFFRNFGVYIPVYSQFQLLMIIILKFMLIVMFIELFRKKGSPIIDTAVTTSGVLIISLCFTALIFLRELFPAGFPFHKFYATTFVDSEQLAQIDRWGGFTVVAVLASIWICDTAAYFGGTKYGRHLLFERVSPKKTWEGSVFGFVFAIIVMLAAKILVLEYLAFQHAIVIGALIGVFGQIGDLIESRFKRDAGVKDSSSLIPGHGGMYDRFDSLVYISPIVYLYINFIVLS
jgi:phosphatidate cytidylyltransferase